MHPIGYCQGAWVRDYAGRGGLNTKEEEEELYVHMINSYHEKHGLVTFEKAISATIVDRFRKWFSSEKFSRIPEAEDILGGT